MAILLSVITRGYRSTGKICLVNKILSRLCCARRGNRRQSESGHVQRGGQVRMFLVRHLRSFLFLLFALNVDDGYAPSKF